MSLIIVSDVTACTKQVHSFNLHLIIFHTKFHRSNVDMQLIQNV